MSKFEKRLKKSTKDTNNALVVGSAFGYLENLLSMYQSVFVIDNTKPNIKAKNLIYREDFNHLNNIVDVGVIFFDLDKISLLENVKEFWKRNNSYVIIEGNDSITREFSKPLFDTNWGCTSLQGMFHVWEKIK